LLQRVNRHSEENHSCLQALLVKIGVLCFCQYSNGNTSHWSTGRQIIYLRSDWCL